MLLAQGGKFHHGFLSGFVSSLGGSYMDKNRGDMTVIEKIAISAAIGGTAEALGGGKFANGAVTGAYVMAFNHLMHESQDPPSVEDKSSSQKSETTGQEKPSPIIGLSSDVTLALPGLGFTFEYGFFTDPNTGEFSSFWAFGPSYGLEISAGAYNFTFIFPKEGFKFSDLEGLGSSLTGNKWIFSGSVLGNSKPSIPSNTTFETYWGFKIGIGPGWGGSAAPATETRFIKNPSASDAFMNSRALFRR